MKTRRTLHTDAEVERARQRIAHDPEAEKWVADLLAKADDWVRRDDAWLETVITPASVPRAFNAHHMGCPVHGTEYFKHGNYSFKFSLDRPFKIVCPVGGEEYPSNDFAAFLASGMADRSLLTGDCPDDGWGWVRPGDDKKWWFVAYYNHWAWMGEIVPGILALSRACLLTGNPAYAHKAGLLLHRVADVYPGMDHNKQSRYATEFQPAYQGRIVNCIWECGLASDFAEAYDNIFDDLDRVPALHERLGKSPEAIRAHIEKDLLDEIVSGVYRGQIRGNYGMHQHTLITAAVVRQAGDQEAVLDFLLRTVGSPLGYTYEGLDLLMDNLIHRDGVSVTENAPAYAWIWVERILRVAEILNKLGVNLYRRHPGIRELLLHPLRETVLGKFSPTVGDFAGVTAGHVALPRWCAEIGCREYGDPRLLDYLQGLDAAGPAALREYEDLFREPFEPPARPSTPKPAPEFEGAYNFGGYGQALLRAGRGENRRAVALWYGASIGHGHRDKLMLEVYARGRKLLPDLGYPQFTDDHPERDAWTKNTISHATVTVNARMQTAPAKGDLHLFAAVPGVQVVEAAAESNYPGLVSRYRRTVSLIDISDREAYVVDLFRVRGGYQHDYSLHGPYGDLETEGIHFSDPAPGTLADPDVPYTFLYDDPELSKPGARGFGRYGGSGFSYLQNPQRAQAAAPWRATWRVKELDGGPTRDRITCFRLPVAPENTFTADGIPPFKASNPPVLKYLISRRTGQDMESSFVSLFVPHGTDCPVHAVRLLPGSPDGETVALAVERPGETDLIFSALDATVSHRFEGGAVFRGRFGVLTLNAAGHPVRATLFGGGELTLQGQGLTLPGDLLGTVEPLDPEARTVTLSVDDPAALPENPADLTGRECLVHVATARVPHRAHRTAGLRIHTARRSGNRLVLDFGPQNLQTARFPVESIDRNAATARTRAHLPLAAIGAYDGAYATDASGKTGFRIETIDPDGTVHFTGKRTPDEAPLTLRVFEIGPGDRVTIHSVGQRVWA